MNIEEIKEYLKHNLSKERFEHSLGVMERAEEYAKIHGCDVETAKVVGLAHDIAKELTIEESLEYAEKNNIELDEIEKAQPYLLHGKIGAYICKEKFGFTKQMQEAIINHTTGSEDMDLLAKIILVADKTEKYRRYEDLDYAVSIAENGIRSYNRNYLRWSKVELSELGYTGEYLYISDWLVNRIEWLNIAFNSNEFVEKGEGLKYSSNYKHLK